MVPRTFVLVGTTSVLVVAEQPGALERIFTNDSPNVIYLSLGSATAIVGRGVRLNANGGSWTAETYTGAVQGIATGASSNLCFSVV